MHLVTSPQCRRTLFSHHIMDPRFVKFQSASVCPAPVYSARNYVAIPRGTALGGAIDPRRISAAGTPLGMISADSRHHVLVRTPKMMEPPAAIVGGPWRQIIHATNAVSSWSPVCEAGELFRHVTGLGSSSHRNETVSTLVLGLVTSTGSACPIARAEITSQSCGICCCGDSCTAKCACGQLSRSLHHVV